jgi:mannan endo-1,4-beta-mannosidase
MNILKLTASHLYLLLTILSSLINTSGLRGQNKDAAAIMKYFYELPTKENKRLVSGQFERWGDAVKPLSDSDNFLNIVHQKTGKWVGLAGVEYHQGQKVNYKIPNQLCIDYWEKGGFCQLYLIMSNPADPGSNNGGGLCDLKLVLQDQHPYNKYFINELDKVADGLEELKTNGVIVFVNMFAEATGKWFWWGAKDPTDFIALYKTSYNYLVHTRNLDNLLFVYEPSSQHKTALDYYPGDSYVDMIGISLFVDYNKEIDGNTIPNYNALRDFGKPMSLSQWGPRRGSDQTRDKDQPPSDNLKLIRGIQRYYPEVVWWMNWSYAYSISTKENSNYNDKELLSHPWVINAEEIDWKKYR